MALTMLFAAVMQRTEVVIALGALLIVQAIDNQPVAKVTINYTDEDIQKGGSDA
jgi:hypothetical protein